MAAAAMTIPVTTPITAHTVTKTANAMVADTLWITCDP